MGLKVDRLIVAANGVGGKLSGIVAVVKLRDERRIGRCQVAS
jgi:hypothetical protein